MKLLKKETIELKSRKELKWAHLSGLIISFLSFFLDWYAIQVFNSDLTTVASWNYNPFTGWSTIFSENNTFNTFIRPPDLSIPTSINIVFFAMLFLSAYGLITKDVEQIKKLEMLRPWIVANYCVLITIGYYIVGFPMMYLFPNYLYFPFVLMNDKTLKLNFYYCLGPGYFLQLISFALAFPNTIFLHQIAAKFESKELIISKLQQDQVKMAQESVDLDKLIAEEETKLNWISERAYKQFEQTVNKKREKKIGRI